MGQQNIAFDQQLFERTAALFASKRRDFSPDAIKVLANDIVVRLARSAPQGPSFARIDISDENITAFCDVLIQPEPDAALEFITARRAEGITRQGVYLGYIAVAARRLGEGWDESRLSFADVTYGTGHLYALMRALRAERPAPSKTVDQRKHALFATVPGEDHGIGITMATDLFRDDGWDIDLKTDTDHDGLIAYVERTQPRIIGLSLSTPRRLDALVRLVVAVRLVMPYAIIGVAPAGDMDAERVRALVDIDLLFEDACSACAELDRLIVLRDRS
jgi:methanogenic corrinoid protein MtbC1